MVKSCSAKGCSYQYLKGDGLKLHRFPTKPEWREKWIKALKHESTPSKSLVICSQHFEPSCYELSANGNLILKRGSVPTIFFESKSIRPVITSGLSKVLSALQPEEMVHLHVEDECEEELDEPSCCHHEEGSDTEQNTEDEGTTYIYQDGTESHDIDEPEELEIIFKADCCDEESNSITVPPVSATTLETVLHSDSDIMRDDARVAINLENVDNDELLNVSPIPSSVTYTKSQTIHETDDLGSNDPSITGELPSIDPATKMLPLPNHRRVPHYLNEFQYDDLKCEVQRRKYWIMSHKVHEMQKKKNRVYTAKISMLQKQVEKLRLQLKAARKMRWNSPRKYEPKKLVYIIS